MAGDLDNRRTERMPWKRFKCGHEDHLISKLPKPPKKNEKLQKQACFNGKGNHVCNNGKNNSDQKIYAPMASMSDNDECPCGNFGDSLQLTKLDFRFWSNVSHDTRGLGSHYGFVRRYI